MPGAKKGPMFNIDKEKLFLSETTRLKALIFGLLHHLMDIYHICSNYAHGAKNGLAPEVTWFT